MGNNISLCVVKYPARPKTPWKVDVPASLGGRRLRRFFRTKVQAEKYTRDFLERVIRGGAAEAVGGMSVGLALSRYEEAKLPGVGKRQAETIKLHCRRIRDSLGPIRLQSLTVRDVERYVMQPQWSKRTQWNCLCYLRTFLRWCERRDLCDKNPADRLAEEIQKPEAPKAILTVEEMGLLLRLTRRDPILRAFVVLGGFVGIRSIEIMRLRWEDVNLQEREVHIRPDVIKKTKGVRERFVSLNSTALRWLERGRHPKVVPMSQWAFLRRSEGLMERMRKVMARLKIGNPERWHDWPQNCLRHSFASYLLAVKQDAGYVAYQMGHTSADMVYQAYARAVRKADAERYWAL